MTLVARVRIDPAPPYDNFIFSNDPEDQVGAFINGELRGTAKLTYVPPPTNQWMAFVTIYGNTSDIGDSVKLEIFDASACLHYQAYFGSGGTFTFTPNGTQGAPSAPRVLQNGGLLIHEIPVQKGWNWISFNLDFPNPTINNVLNNIPNPAGDLVKDQTKFASFNNNTWSGSLATIGNTSMYMYQSAAQPKTIKITGNALTPASEPIAVANGWNWIAYIPNYKLTVNGALASLPGTAGDIIKSQTAFATYVSNTVGWVGDLKTLEPPQGYLLRMATGGTLTYPPQSFATEEPIVTRNGGMPAFWNVDASKYEHNMTLIGIFQYDEINATSAEMELGAFAGDELRGAGQAVYIDFLDSYMFFLTCFANTSGEQLNFKLYDAATGGIQQLDEKMMFIPNYHQGSIVDPFPFTLQTTGTGDAGSELSFNVQPNPFRDETVCLIELPVAQKVYLIVTDMDGRQVYSTSIRRK